MRRIVVENDIGFIFTNVVNLIRESDVGYHIKKLTVQDKK
ncbi:MAG: hypothetical protein BWY08_00389 [Bacteroidetes bacterium ADurb.Bin174]|nr:MAG: hypothetical protein BWY08_00389 [Bacteroidetes bacterium ADurb.Bin174]